VSAISLTANNTEIQFPNHRGLWLLDTSAIKWNGHNLILAAGNATGATITLTSTNNTLMWLQSTGNNDIRPIGAP
jgi:hypothetical protein